MQREREKEKREKNHQAIFSHAKGNHCDLRSKDSMIITNNENTDTQITHRNHIESLLHLTLFNTKVLGIRTNWPSIS